MSNIGKTPLLLRGALVMAVGGVWCFSKGREFAVECLERKFRILHRNHKTVCKALAVLSSVGAIAAGGSLIMGSYWIGKAVVMGTSLHSSPMLFKIGGMGAVIAIFARVLLELGEIVEKKREAQN
jgi:hypothetical protein